MCLVLKTTCVDRGRPLREGAFLLARTMLFPPLDKKNTRDKVKGLRVASERHIGELGVRCLSALNRGQDSRQQTHEEVGLCHARHPIAICQSPPLQTSYRINLCRRVRPTDTGTSEEYEKAYGSVYEVRG